MGLKHMTKFKAIFGAVAAAAALAGVQGAAHAAERELVEVEAPEYPRGAERRQLEGYVTVRYNVTPEGQVADIEVVEATPEGVFERAVLRAMEAWRYAPAAEATPLERRFDFQLSD